MKHLLPLLVFAAGCRDWPDYAGAFNVPSALGVLQPELGTPFAEPVGFVGNQHGGQIAMLALKQGRFLTDDRQVAFLRGNQIATGQQRVLAGLAPYVHPDGRITVFAFDRRFEEIVETPYVTSFDASGFPVEPETSYTPPVFSDVDASGDVATLDDIVIKTGWTATEDWTVRYDGAAWVVEGSRSGVMPTKANTGEAFVGTDRAVAFTINGTATTGDLFRFSTDSGALFHDAGGLPMEVRMAPDNSVAAVVVHDTVRDLPVLRLFDPLRPSDFSASAPVALGAGSAPGRLAWDVAGADLFVSDHLANSAWRVHWDDPLDRAAYTVERIPLPWPTLDVAPLLSDVGQQLFVVPEDGSTVWSYDLTKGVLRDVNPWREGPQGLRFNAPVRGIEALPIPYLQLETNDDGDRDFDSAVAISLASGQVVFADERSACAVEDGFGPQTRSSSQVVTTADFSRSYEGTAPRGTTLTSNLSNSRHVLANPCGGITRTQNWTLRFDQLQQGWEVIGSRSGRQPTLAFEDIRYTSDDGEISFLLVSGQTPSEDGFRISFRMVEGLTKADGDEDGQPATFEITLDQPGDPLYFHYLVGPEGAPIDDRPHVLVAGQSSDRVGRVDPQEGTIDATWD